MREGDNGMLTTKESRGNETTNLQEKGQTVTKSVLRDVRHAEEDDNWREKTVDREKWKELTDGAEPEVHELA